MTDVLVDLEKLNCKVNCHVNIMLYSPIIVLIQLPWRR